MNEDLLSDLWGEGEEEDKPREKEKRTRKKKKTSEHPRRRAPELDLKGFSCEIGTVRRMVRKSKEDATKILAEVPVVVSKDPRCWILRIGGETTYPASLTGLFLTLTKEEFRLEGITTLEEILAAVEEARDRIIEKVATLEKKVEEWDRSSQYKEMQL
jgi:hypothetical protein